VVIVMSGHGNDWWTRADWARWFIEHDDVDEAARLLEPGDQLTLGQSGYLDLAAALARRGLAASYEDGSLRVRPGTGVPSGARKPPARVAPAAPASARKRSA
jgi:hypothetical protein